jgi:exoribonuclease-2
MGAQDAARGAQFKVRLGDINFITLDIQGTVLEHLDATSTSNPNTEAEAEDAETDDAGVAASLSLAIAVDVEEPTPQHPSENSPAAG